MQALHWRIFRHFQSNDSVVKWDSFQLPETLYTVNLTTFSFLFFSFVNLTPRLCFSENSSTPFSCFLHPDDFLMAHTSRSHHRGRRRLSIFSASASFVFSKWGVFSQSVCAVVSLVTTCNYRLSPSKGRREGKESRPNILPEFYLLMSQNKCVVENKTKQKIRVI